MNARGLYLQNQNKPRARRETTNVNIEPIQREAMHSTVYTPTHTRATYVCLYYKLPTYTYIWRKRAMKCSVRMPSINMHIYILYIYIVGDSF